MVLQKGREAPLLRLRTEERPGLTAAWYLLTSRDVLCQPPLPKPQWEGQGLGGLRRNRQVQANIRRAGWRLSFGSRVRAVAKQWAHGPTWPPAEPWWPLHAEL